MLVTVPFPVTALICIINAGNGEYRYRSVRQAARWFVGGEGVPVYEDEEGTIECPTKNI